MILTLWRLFSKKLLARRSASRLNPYSGYDDLDFISGFDDKDVAEMLNNVGINKQGHRKKLESALKIRNSVLSENKRKGQESVEEKEPKKKESELNFHSMNGALNTCCGFL